jgi:ribosomal-protein-alanine N-acetyltransferase
VVLVAETLADVLGFVVVQSAGGNAELEAVAVKAEARRRGVARSLCGQAIAWSRKGNESPGATEMHLEVRAGNAAALSFYQKLGFIEQGRRRGYYRDPEEDAVVMGLVLNGAEDVGNALDAKESAAFGE